MALEFYPELERLLNPTHDLGGGPGGPEAADAIAQLILGGGRAMVGDTPIFGEPIRPVAAPQASQVPAPSPALPRSLHGVLEAAKQMAEGLSPNATADKTLIGNPYGPGSYDPNIPAERQAIQAQGLRQREIDNARNLLTSPTIGSLPGVAQGQIIKNILNQIGITEAPKPGAKKPINPELLRAAGTDDFPAKFAEEVAMGRLDNPGDQLSLERLHDSRVQKKRVPDVDRRSLTNLRGSYDLLGDLKEAYEATPAFQTGKLSDTLKTSLSLNNKVAALQEAQLISGTGLTPEEQRFVAKYNAFLLGLRRLADEGRFSDQDAVRALQAIGNPLVGRELYPQQIEALRDDLAVRYTTQMEDLEATGRDVSKLRGSKPEPGSKKGAPKVGTVVKGFRFKGGDPSKQSSWEKVK